MEAAAGALAAARASRLFGDLDEEQARALASLLRPFSAAGMETLFRAGAPVERLLVLGSGSAGVGEPVAAVVRAGETLGELALNGPATHTASATALEPVEGFFLEIRDFELLRSDGDPLAVAVLRRLSRLLATRVRAAGDGIRPAAVRSGPQGTPGAPALDELPFLRALAAFRGFDEQELEELVRSTRTWRLDAGATVFAEGATAHSAFVVLRGAVEVTRERGDRRLRLATVGPGPHARRAVPRRRRAADGDLHRARADGRARARRGRRRRPARRPLAGRARAAAGGEPGADRGAARDRRPPRPASAPTGRGPPTRSPTRPGSA